MIGSKVAQAENPNTGPYEASSVEGAASGDMGGSSAGQPSFPQNGAYENKVASFGNYPHGSPDPELDGPPLASPATQATAAQQPK